MLGSTGLFSTTVKIKKKKTNNISAKLGLRKFKIANPTILDLTYEFLGISSTTKQAWKKTMKQVSLSQLLGTNHCSNSLLLERGVYTFHPKTV